MSEKEVRDLKSLVLDLQRGRANGPSSTVKLYKLEESEEEDTMLVGAGSKEEAGRAALAVGAA